MRFTEGPSQDRIDRFQKKLKIFVSGLVFLVAVFLFVQAAKAVVEIHESHLQDSFPRNYFVDSVTHPLGLGLLLLLISGFLFYNRDDKTPHYYDPRAYEQK